MLAPMYACSMRSPSGGGRRGRPRPVDEGMAALSATVAGAVARRASKLALPAAVAALNRGGLGPLSPTSPGPSSGAPGCGVRRGRRSDSGSTRPPRHLRPHASRRAVPARPAEWLSPGGSQLLNTGCWVYERFSR